MACIQRRSWSSTRSSAPYSQRSGSASGQAHRRWRGQAVTLARRMARRTARSPTLRQASGESGHLRSVGGRLRGGLPRSEKPRKHGASGLWARAVSNHRPLACEASTRGALARLDPQCLRGYRGSCRSRCEPAHEPDLTGISGDYGRAANSCRAIRLRCGQALTSPRPPATFLLAELVRRDNVHCHRQLGVIDCELEAIGTVLGDL
jgi:hypothetical protein